MNMLTKPEEKVTDVNFFNRLFAQALPSSPKPRTHNLTDQVEGANYTFEALDGDRAQMTGYGKGIKGGDYIILTKDKILYRVEDIEYYADPPDLWRALLFRCSADQSNFQ